MREYTGSTDAENIFMKQQSFLEKSEWNDSKFAQCTLQEVLRCEEISANPHKNLARYLGVETKVISGVERAVSIAYERYTMDPDTFVLEKRLLTKDNRDILVQSMQNGMHHVHKLGLVHCDLRPLNVFVTFNREEGDVVLEEVVIGDFDASLKIGDKVKLKRGCQKWWPPAAKWGQSLYLWIDEWCLKTLETWLGNWLKDNGLEDYVWDKAVSTIWDKAASKSPVWPLQSGNLDVKDEIADETGVETADELQEKVPNDWW